MSDLPGSSLPGSDLPGSDLRGSDLRGSDLRGQTQTRAFRQTVLSLMHASSIFSMAAAGLLGAVVTPRLGPFLIMGATIYTGNTDVEPPSAPYPWAPALLGLALLAVGLLRVRREARGGWFLANLGGAMWALAPFLHLYLLWEASLT